MAILGRSQPVQPALILPPQDQAAPAGPVSVTATLAGAGSAATRIAPTCVVSFTFDDGYSSQTQAGSLLGGYGFAATLYAAAGVVTGAGGIGWTNVHTLHDTYGWEIGGHGVNALPSLSIANAAAEVQAARDNLTAQSFPAPVTYAYPLGDYSIREFQYLYRYGFRAARAYGCGRDVTTAPADGPWAVRCYDINCASETLSVIQGWITAAEAAGTITDPAWVVLVIHKLGTPGDGQTTSTTLLTNLCSWLADRTSTEVKTVADVLTGTPDQPPTVVERQRLLSASSAGAAYSSDTTAGTYAVEFSATGSNAYFSAYRWFYATPSTSPPADMSGAGPKTFALYRVDGTGAGTEITEARVTSGDLFLVPAGAAYNGSWNRVPLPDPVLLTSGQRYKAVCYGAGGAPWHGASSGQWTSGVSAGNLTGYSDAASTDGQGSYHSGSGLTYPVTGGSGTGYGMDVEVCRITVLPPDSGGSRLWPATSGGPVAAEATANDNGVEFSTSASEYLYGYWWWVPASGADTAWTSFHCDLWDASVSTTVPVSGSTTVAGTTFTAGQWNWIGLDKPIALVASRHYRASITYTSGLANHYGYTSNYWSTGAGGSGITSGNLTAPNNAGATMGGLAAAAQGSYNSPTTGNMPVSAFNATNYWLDVQTGPAAGESAAAALAAAGDVTATATIAVTAALHGAGGITAAATAAGGAASATATLTAAGTITAATQISVTAALTGAGGITATAAGGAVSVTAWLAGAGNTAAAASASSAVSPFTVTASITAAGFYGGSGLKILVLTNATETGGAADNAVITSGTAATRPLTPNYSGSAVIWGISDLTTGSNAFTAAGSNTIDYQPAPTGWRGAVGHYTGTVTQGSQLTYGCSAPTVDNKIIAGYEVPASGGTIAFDGSAPAGVGSTAASQTSGSFSPPAGAVLAACFTTTNGTAATCTYSISDTSGLGLTWTPRAVQNTSSTRYLVIIWTATVPGGASTVPVTAVLPGAGHLTATATIAVTALLTGAGSAAATTTAPVAAAGAGSAAATATTAVTAVLPGAGHVAATATIGVTAGLAGSGGTRSGVTLAVTAVLPGAGSTRALAGNTLTAAAALAGAGDVTATAAVAVTAALAGAGAAAASAGSTVAAAAALAATGTVAASATVVAPASLPGAGGLTATVTVAVTAALAGGGHVTATRAGSALAALAAAGSITAVTAIGVTAQLTGQGAVTAGTGTAVYAAAAPAGSGGLTGGATLAANGTDAGAGAAGAQPTIGVGAAIGTVPTVTATATIGVTALLTGGGTAGSAAKLQGIVSAAIAGEGSAGSGVILGAAATLTGSGTATGEGAGFLSVTAALAGSGGCAAAGFSGRSVSAALTGAGRAARTVPVLQVQPVAGGAGTLAGMATVSAAAVLAAAGQAALDVRARWPDIPGSSISTVNGRRGSVTAVAAAAAAAAVSDPRDGWPAVTATTASLATAGQRE